MGLKSFIKKAAGKVFKKNPLLFSALPAPVKRDVFNEAKARAEDATNRQARAKQENDELKAKRDGLSFQLLATQGNRQSVDFENSDPANYRRYLKR